MTALHAVRDPALAGRGARTVCSCGGSSGPWAIATLPGRSRVASRGCGGRTKPGWAPETQTSPYTRPQGPSGRAVSFTWVCAEAKRSQDAQLYVDQLRQADPAMAQAYTLSQAFLALVRERRGDALEAWMTEAVASRIETLARFAQGLQEDLAAVTAGLTLPWSNGPVEGHINRLTLLKRQGYGRAGCCAPAAARSPAGRRRPTYPGTDDHHDSASALAHGAGTEVGAAPMAA